LGLPMRDRAKSAVPRAGVAHEHERGGTVGPAFGDVWAARFRTDGGDRGLVHDLAGARISRAARNANANPVGVSAAMRRRRSGRWGFAHRGAPETARS